MEASLVSAQSTCTKSSFRLRQVVLRKDTEQTQITGNDTVKFFLVLNNRFDIKFSVVISNVFHLCINLLKHLFFLCSDIYKLTYALIFNAWKQFHQIYFLFPSTKFAKMKATLSVAVHYQLLNLGTKHYPVTIKRIQMKESVIISHTFIPPGVQL